jgi:hypothetical protein
MEIVLLLVVFIAFFLLGLAARSSSCGFFKSSHPSTLTFKRLRPRPLASCPIPPPSIRLLEALPEDGHHSFKRELMSTPAQLQSVVDAFDEQTTLGQDSSHLAPHPPSTLRHQLLIHYRYAAVSACTSNALMLLNPIAV